MKIVAIETLCASEFENVLWARLHTDAGAIGLGETFYGAGAVASHIHDTLATRLLGRDPLCIEALHKELVNLPMAQSSTGAEYRAASAIDIALWDLWGKVTNQPVHQLLGGLCRDRLRIYNTCAGYQYVRNRDIRPVNTWNIGDRRALRRLERLHDRRRRLGGKPARKRHQRHENLALRPGGERDWRRRHFHRTAQGGAAPVRTHPQARRRQDGHHGRVPLAVEPHDR